MRNFVLDRIGETETDVLAWRELHDKLKRLIREKGAPEPNYGDEGTGSVEIDIDADSVRWEWAVEVHDYHMEGDDEITNKWGHPLTDIIHLDFWLRDDDTTGDRSVSDDPKIALVCSPRGVIDTIAEEQLSLQDVERLIYDPILFPQQ